MKKRMGAFLLAGAMLLSMTGCGNNKADDYSKYVELGEYKGIEYTKTEVEITDDDVQAEIDTFLAGLATKEEVTDRAVKDGDIVNIDFVGSMDGVEFEGGYAEGHDLTIGSNSFIDGFEDGLIGHEIGEKVTLDLVFPDPYENDPEKAGKDVTFDVTINSISVSVTPELTDAVVKENTDYDTVKAYEDSIREELQTTGEANAEAKVQSDIFNQVVKNSKVNGFDEEEVKKLVDEEFEGFKKQAESYESYGYTYEMVLQANGYENEKQLKEGITEYVKNYLTQKMVLYMIADKEGITVTSEETDALVKEYMTNYGVQTEEEVYDYFGDDYFELSLMSEKVMAFLKENAVLVDSLDETTEAAAEATTEAE
ncbi:MAG: trigger factor [Lachnospiraceae bacterium]|nr:trigger factor [Lachnospiraceae bacterium]